MENVISPIVLGVFLLVIGVLNMRGNISSVRMHHRHRVAKEDILPYGRLVGLGTIVIGVSIIVYGLTRLSKINFFIILGAILLAVGAAVGLILMFWAMIKYNKGIF